MVASHREETLSSKNIFKHIISSSFSVQMFSFILTFLRIGRYQVVDCKTNDVCKQSVTIFSTSSQAYCRASLLRNDGPIGDPSENYTVAI